MEQLQLYVGDNILNNGQIISGGILVEHGKILEILNKEEVKGYTGRANVENDFHSGGILVENGKIVEILELEELRAFMDIQHIEVIDAGTNVIMAGLIDTHVHLNEPGRTDWEGFVTGTQAAAAGGFTTIVDMPLNSIPPTNSTKNLNIKLQAAKGKTFVDVAFWGALFPGNQNELPKMVEAGVRGFKGFMVAAGTDDFKMVAMRDIEIAYQTLVGKNTVLLFHAEVERNNTLPPTGDPTKFKTYLDSRPQSMEIEAIQEVINFARTYNVRSHIVHISAGDSLPMIKEAKASGVPITVETCHHYLTFADEDIPDRATQYKCTPPIRDKHNQTLLWEGLWEGTIDMITSDHSPCPPALKNLDTGNFLTAWGGISSVQFGLSLFWTNIKYRGYTIQDIPRYMAEGPATLAGLQHFKGKIAPGYDADFVIWDPDGTIKIEESMILHRHKLTPYLGKTLYGKVLKTIVRGQVVYEDQKPFGNAKGKLLISDSHVF